MNIDVGNTEAKKKLRKANVIAAVLMLPVSYLVTIVMRPIWMNLGDAIGVSATTPSGLAFWCYILGYLFSIYLAISANIKRYRVANMKTDAASDDSKVK